MYKILVVDDDKDILQFLKINFMLENYTVFTAQNYAELLEALKYQPDLILLDVGMPNMDGFTICKKIRNIVFCPIIFLTARDEEKDRIIGFKQGGDDYIIKPFSLDELLARVQAHLRREERRKINCTLRFFNDLIINYSARFIKYKEREIVFTKREFDIIELLLFFASTFWRKLQAFFPMLHREIP